MKIITFFKELAGTDLLTLVIYINCFTLNGVGKNCIMDVITSFEEKITDMIINKQSKIEKDMKRFQKQMPKI